MTQEQFNQFVRQYNQLRGGYTELSGRSLNVLSSRLLEALETVGIEVGE